MAALDLAVATIRDDLAFFLQLLELGTLHTGETPLGGDDNLLASRELVLGTTESLQDMDTDVVTRTDRQKDLSNVHTSTQTLGLSEGTSHTGLETISTGTGQHLVDTQDMEGMNTDAEMEGILTTLLTNVLVARNTGSLQSLRGDLLLLEGDEMDA